MDLLIIIIVEEQTKKKIHSVIFSKVVCISQLFTIMIGRNILDYNINYYFMTQYVFLFLLTKHKKTKKNNK